MAALVDQVPDDAADRLRADAAAVEYGIEENVDSCMAISRLLLLPELHHAGDPAFDLDRETDRLRLVGEREVVLGHAPPAADLRRRVDPPQLRYVPLLERADVEIGRHGHDPNRAAPSATVRS